MTSSTDRLTGPIRLRCGVVFTEGFVRYLHDFFREGQGEHPGCIPTIAYVKFAEGKREGEEWLTLRWEDVRGLGDDCRFEEAGAPLGISKQSQRGLGSNYVDFVDGRIVVG